MTYHGTADVICKPEASQCPRRHGNDAVDEDLAVWRPKDVEYHAGIDTAACAQCT